MIHRAAQLSSLVYPLPVVHGLADGIAHDRGVVIVGAAGIGVDFVQWHDDTGTDTEFAILRDPQNGITWIAVRGTTSLRDVYTDISATRRPFTSNIGSVLIHSGGYYCAMSAIGTIMTHLRNYPFDDVILCGHSLGGMIAQILAVMVTTRTGAGARMISTVTFGQPRAGCHRFARALQAIDGTHARVYHRADPVAWLPGALSRLTPWPRYVHAGEPIRLESPGFGIAAHRMAGYLDSVSKI